MNTSIGLCKPYVAKYAANGGTPSYSGGKSIGMATDFSLNIDGRDPSILYADNGPAESIAIFGGGTATLGVHRLTNADLAMMLGYTPENGGGITFAGDPAAPYLGLGIIATEIADNVISYNALILYKVQLKQPDVTLNTKGESVEYQVPSLEYTVLRDDSSTGKWMHLQNYETEAAAEAAIKTALAIS